VWCSDVRSRLSRIARSTASEAQQLVPTHHHITLTIVGNHPNSSNSGTSTSSSSISFPPTIYQPPSPIPHIYRLLFATLSSSSFFLIAYELLLPFAALISSSAKHSATLFTLRNAASRAPIVSRAMAWLTRRRGETSTA